MLEKAVLLILIYASLYFFDMTKLKNKSRREWITYGIFTMLTLYLSTKYIFGFNWINMYELIEMVLGKPAKYIFDSLNVTP